MTDVLGAVFAHPIATILLREAVVKQVAASGILCHKIHLTVHCKLLNKIDDMIAILAEFESLRLGNAVLLLKPIVLLHLDGLNRNLRSGEFMLANKDWITGSLTNGPRNGILI